MEDKKSQHQSTRISAITTSQHQNVGDRASSILTITYHRSNPSDQVVSDIRGDQRIKVSQHQKIGNQRIETFKGDNVLKVARWVMCQQCKNHQGTQININKGFHHKSKGRHALFSLLQQHTWWHMIVFDKDIVASDVVVQKDTWQAVLAF